MAVGLTDRTSRLEVAEFARHLGLTSPDELSDPCRETLSSAELGYHELSTAERDACLLRALRRSDAPDLTVSGPHRHGDWERGWQENLQALDAAERAASIESLVPKYNGYEVLRLAGNYVRVEDTGFEYAVYTALRQHLFPRYFADCRGVAEFGCGTGTSLLVMRELFPDHELIGLDWAEASQDILERLDNAQARIRGQRFDMFEPSSDFALEPGFGVLTSAALEQIGPDHTAFLDYLLEQAPSICLHIEPIVELYDPDELFDDVAIRYHDRRNYLRGFLPRLLRLEAEGRVEMLEVRRAFFGSFFHEGYSIVAWRPTAGAWTSRGRS